MVSVPAEISTVTPTEIVAVLRMRSVPDVPAEPSMYATLLESSARNHLAVLAARPVVERTGGAGLCGRGAGGTMWPCGQRSRGWRERGSRRAWPRRWRLIRTQGL